MVKYSKVSFIYKISLIIILFNLSGACVQAGEKAVEETDVNGKTISLFNMPDKEDKWYREQFEKIWDTSMITVDRRKNVTPDTLRLMTFHGDFAGGLTDRGKDIIAFSSSDLNTRPLGWREYTIAHEFVHFAHEDRRSLIDPHPYFLKKYRNKKNGYNISYREFYADLKGLELLKKGNPKAFDDVFHFFYLGAEKGKQRSEEYPSYAELLLYWAAYESQNVSLVLLVKFFLENRAKIKSEMKKTGFLERIKQVSNSSDTWDKEQFYTTLKEAMNEVMWHVTGGQ